MATYNFGDVDEGFKLGGLSNRAGSYNMSQTQFAPLQTGTAQRFTPQTSEFAQPNSVQMPSWMSSADGNMQELLKTYKKVPKAFDPTDQVDARNNAIAYQTSAGGQAANNAATEYANRAMQQGGSALGAGVVKAQSMMPVFAANAGLKSEAADIAAKAHQGAVDLSARIAQTIAGLRESHLSTMANFTANQQQMAMQNNQFNSQLGLSAFNANTQADLGYKDLALRRDSLSLQESDQARLAATTLLGLPGPSGGWSTGGQGQVTDGQANYDRYQEWLKQKEAATGALTGMYR